MNPVDRISAEIYFSLYVRVFGWIRFECLDSYDVDVAHAKNSGPGNGQDPQGHTIQTLHDAEFSRKVEHPL